MSAPVSQALRTGAARLSEAGIDPGDARYLLAHVLEVPRDRLILMGQDPLSDTALARFERALSRRLAHEPVSKIIGRRAFWGHMFEVTADVLDPRPETESLIEAALAGPAPARILDLGTGSGCIVVTLLAAWPGATAIATDVSKAALRVAARNAEHVGVRDRLTLLESDWFGSLKGEFDLIVSNPPYITEAEMRQLTPEILGHDPHLALSPGGDGLQPYRVIAAQGQRFLAPRGRLLLEIGWRQGADVMAFLRDSGWSDIQVLTDMDGRDRVVTATGGEKAPVGDSFFTGSR